MKISLCLTKQHSAMIAYVDLRFWLYWFLTLALAGVVSSQPEYPPSLGENPNGTYEREGCLFSETSLVALK